MSQIQHVLLNLLINAEQALRDNPAAQIFIDVYTASAPASPACCPTCGARRILATRTRWW